MRWLGIALLLLAVLKHFGIEWVPPADQWETWNAIGALATTALLIIVGSGRGPVVGAVVGWWVYEEMLVWLCSELQVIDWRPVAEGEQQCSARFGSHAMHISFVVLGFVLSRVTRNDAPRQ